ncbi:MAG: PepSY domain-containing protein [Anaerolineae bacterium]|nr:PepSY domain-containing protein [Anaerolineae bacterium]
MRINSKRLLSILVITLLALAVGGVMFVVAQDATLASNVEILQNDTDDIGDNATAATEVTLTQDEAIVIAEAARDTTAILVELESEHGVNVYSIELADNSEVEVNANTGEIIEIELPSIDND